MLMEKKMDIRFISVGVNPPEDVHAIIEIPMRGDPVKYEADKKSGAMFVDRFLNTPMRYPYNYGFVPNTLSKDGDPIDIMVISRVPVASGAVIRSRPVGVFVMEDEHGEDEKIIAVPADDVDPYYADIRDITDLPQLDKDQIEHFFSHYKDMEKGKWVKALGWENAQTAKEFIKDAIKRAGH